MFINDLVYHIHHCKYFLYADDIVMFKSLNKGQTDHELALSKQDILSIEKWCLQNELTINIKKTKVQYFPENFNTDCSVFENEEIVKYVTRTLPMLAPLDI